jgi:undecaprenyl-diphosphatase
MEALLSRDLSILLSLQAMTSPIVLYALTIFAAKYLIFILAALVGVLGFGKHKRRDRAFAYTTAWSSLVAFGVSLLIGYIVRRPRPLDLEAVTARIDAPLTEFSFPSSHSSIAFAIAASLTLAHPWLGAIAFAIAILIAIGRVAVGVHYPLDVVSGAALGIFSALLVHWYRLYLLPKYMRKKKS